MIENQEEKLEQYYNSFLEMPRRVEEIFIDFFGEERVELQRMPTLEQFKAYITETNLRNYVDRDSLRFDSDISRLTSSERYAVLELYDRFRESPLTESESSFSLAQYLKEQIERKKFMDMCIIVHFPHVRITNEYDRFVDVNNLWTRVPVKVSGKGYGWFGINRSEYELSHMEADYMHSHMPGINWSDFTHFNSPCTGEGPINATLSSLSMDFDDALWQLFCLELDRYMPTESIAGGPHRRMERIGTATSQSGEYRWIMNYNVAVRGIIKQEDWKDFLGYMLASGKIRYNYINGSYGVAYTFMEWVILVSNLFIEWYNLRFNEGKFNHTKRRLLEYSVIKEALIDNNQIYYPQENSHRRDYRSYIGTRILTFKGQEITLTISGLDSNTTRNRVLVLDPKISEELLKSLLKILNYEYGSNQETGVGISQKNTRFI